MRPASRVSPSHFSGLRSMRLITPIYASCEQTYARDCAEVAAYSGASDGMQAAWRRS